MASGFGRVTTSDYVRVVQSGVTGVKVSGVLSQSVNSSARTVTVTLRATIALYRVSGAWNISAGTKIFGSQASGNYLKSNVGGTEASVTGALGIEGATSFQAQTGTMYSLLDGYVRYYRNDGVFPDCSAEVTASKTFSYNDAGSAISSTWSVGLKAYLSWLGDYQTISASGNFTTDSISPKHSNPTGVSASVASGKTTELSAGLTSISVSAWNDTGSGTRYYAATNSSKSIIAGWGTSSTQSFTIPSSYKCTSTTSALIYPVYAAAKNYNGDIGYSGLYYITSPTAPTFSFTGSASTSPQCVPSATVKYKGGTTNSASSDNASMSRWLLTYKDTGTTSYPSTKQTGKDTGKTCSSFADIAGDFQANKSYNIKVTTINTYGGASESSTTIYCPTGVSGSANTSTPMQITFTMSKTAAGDVGSSTGGTMACYQLKYVELNSSGGEVGSWVTKPKQTGTTLTVNSGLKPATKYKYQITGWNKYGLSATSSYLYATTQPKFDPSFDGKLTFAPQVGGNGVVVSGKILHPGGNTIDESKVTTVSLYMRKKGTSSWGSAVKTLTGKSYGAGATFSFDALSGSSFLSYGNYEFYAIATNGRGDSVSSQVSELSAPSGVYVNAEYDATNLIQINATGATSDTNVTTWDLKIQPSGGSVQTITKSSTSTTTNISTSNHLLFGTTYQVWVVVTNKYGLSQESSKISVTTPKRFSYGYRRQGGSSYSASASIKQKNKSAVNISEVYCVVKNALGNLPVNTNLKNKRLVYPSQKLFYRPESVADMSLSNGRKIAYKLDSATDTYKFGIWNGNTLETVFFNGTAWVPNQGHYYYDFSSTSVTITARSKTSMNSSSAFSLTKCIDIPDWDRS